MPQSSETYVLANQENSVSNPRKPHELRTRRTRPRAADCEETVHRERLMTRTAAKHRVRPQQNLFSQPLIISTRLRAGQKNVWTGDRVDG